MRPTSDIAFSDSVKAVQEARGSRKTFADLEARGGWRAAITPEVAAFLQSARTVYLATTNAAGQPYVQHRGGPPGFLKIADATTIAFADFRGNRQYITTGNLRENPKAFLFVMDYESRRRLKIWGQARVVQDPALIAQLKSGDYKATAEQAIVFTVEAWDTNCPQHIPQLFAAEDVGRTIQQFQARVRELEAEVAELKARLAAE
ncbi:MAG: pyridoxamine 5'-phosphate oxidase family protein [Hyphomicrobiaceae bacterium]